MSIFSLIFFTVTSAFCSVCIALKINKGIGMYVLLSVIYCRISVEIYLMQATDIPVLEAPTHEGCGLGPHMLPHKKNSLLLEEVRPINVRKLLFLH